MNDPVHNSGRAAAWPPIHFPLGRVLATRGALSLMERLRLQASDVLRRHQHGDFGDICEADKTTNREAIVSGARVLSAYEVGPERERIWVLTEGEDDFGERRTTCLLLPSEY